MRRYQKWLSVGLLALTPGVTLAGPLNSPIINGTSNQRQTTPGKTVSNQDLANRVAGALRKAKLNGFEIEISVQNGVATLDGMVGSADQKAAAQKAAMVSGITKVNNRLQVGEPQMRPVVGAPRSAGRSQPIRPTNFQTAAAEGQDPLPSAPPPAMMGQGGTPPAALPAYGPPGGGASHIVYNQPSFPNYSWPTYAQYPNYAAVTYPSQYAASAWPYIGPFYPYPQVPLGWRKAQLEWDDGYWNLNFRARTDRWWWFLDPRNW
jgi:hypothetical protein